MKASDQQARPGAALRAVIAAIGLAVLPACDPATLSEDQRRLVTGTSDVGDITSSVDPPEATVEDTLTVSYHVSSRGFAGTLSLSLSALPAEVALVKDINHKMPVAVEGNRDIDGTFELRVARERDQPVDVFLNLTSVGVAGSRVEHPPARVRLLLRPPRLGLECHRDPKEGTAPLAVHFGSRWSGCIRACAVHWDFDDGTSVHEPDSDHTYKAPGRYVAVAVLTDEGGRVTSCQKDVMVSARTPEPAPTPSLPPPAPPPTASFTLAATCCPWRLGLDASGSAGSIVSYAWDLSWTPAAPDATGTSPTASFSIQESTTGTVTLTVTAADGQTASLTRAYP